MSDISVVFQEKKLYHLKSLAYRFLSWLVDNLVTKKRYSEMQGFILLYHRISDEEDWSYPPLPLLHFQAHCGDIKKHFTVLPLAELVERRRNRQPLGGCCAITFDDGYLDYLTNAAPILCEYGLPSTNFLVSDCVLTGVTTWNARLLRCLYKLKNKNFFAQRESKYSGTTLEEVGQLSAADREQFIIRLEEEVKPEPGPSMITASHLVSNSLINYGSHTKTHAMLNFQSAQGVYLELKESREVLGPILGKEPEFVAYPSGQYSPSIVECAQSAGYEAAFIVGQRHFSHSDSLFALPRFDVGALWGAFVRLELLGVLNSIRRGVSKPRVR
jgi:peptidoglycan/xylan/chitin deacetylase (PgdA/CDA1 family)